MMHGYTITGMMGTGWPLGRLFFMWLTWLLFIALAGFVFGLLFWAAQRLVMNVSSVSGEKSRKQK